MNGLDALTNLPTEVQVVIGVLIACQIIAMVWALVRLAGDKRERVVGLARPLWAAIIVFGQIIGPVVFIIVHAREQRAIAEQKRYQQAGNDKATSCKDASSVISGLYGE